MYTAQNLVLMLHRVQSIYSLRALHCEDKWLCVLWQELFDYNLDIKHALRLRAIALLTPAIGHAILAFGIAISGNTFRKNEHCRLFDCPVPLHFSIAVG